MTGGGGTTSFWFFVRTTVLKRVLLKMRETSLIITGTAHKTTICYETYSTHFCAEKRNSPYYSFFPSPRSNDLRCFIHTHTHARVVRTLL